MKTIYLQTIRTFDLIRKSTRRIKKIWKNPYNIRKIRRMGNPVDHNRYLHRPLQVSLTIHRTYRYLLTYAQRLDAEYFITFILLCDYIMVEACTRFRYKQVSFCATLQRQKTNSSTCLLPKWAVTAVCLYTAVSMPVLDGRRESCNAKTNSSNCLFSK